jgi:transcriptional regulator with GAF, ATPase, and Fis domain
MSERPWLTSALFDFDAAVQTAVEVEAAGLVLAAADRHVKIRLRQRGWTVAHFFPRVDLPEILRPSVPGVRTYAPLRDHLDPARILDNWLLNLGIESLLVVPLPGEDGVSWAGQAAASPLSEAYVAGFERLVDRLAAQLREPESVDARMTRLSRFDAVEALLPLISGVLDIREVFQAIAEVAQKVLPHDAAAVMTVSEDLRSVRLHALSGRASEMAPEEFPSSHAPLLNERFLYSIYDDMSAHSRERDKPAARLGMRSALRLPLRFEGRVGGVLEFSSMDIARFSELDVAVAHRVADCVALALSHERLAEEVRRSADARQRATALERRVEVLTDQLETVGGYRTILGVSAPWKAALAQATRVADTDTTVLLLGESGTGKEVVARFIHRASSRSRGPFVAINCAALPEHLLESELFGFERGAFTGATQSKPGQLEEAAGGVLFLDEVGEMSPPAQAKFLRALQEREFRRLGGNRTIRADVRVIAATNRDLQQAMERGAFREDLYYRLNVFELRLPPLRERRDDILPLSEGFIAEIGRTLGRPPAGVSRDAREALFSYHWLGNVRELRNVLERAAILCDGGLIAAEHLALRPALATAVTVPPAAPPVAERPPHGDLKSVERQTIERALTDARFNKSQAAKRLGLSRAQLYSRLRRHGLE